MGISPGCTVQTTTEKLGSLLDLDLLSRYEEVRNWTCRLVEPLSAEDQIVQSMPDASPTKWHLAHTTWFFETFLLSQLQGYKLFDSNYRMLFNSYYKQLGKHPVRSTRGTFSRPSLDEVWEYRRFVDTGMRKFLSSQGPSGVAALVQLGLNHEQQHQELIVTDIKHAFWSQPLRPAFRPSNAKTAGSPPALSWYEFPGGIVEIGHSGNGFAFDNESPRHQVLLKPFKLASRLITNAEYLEFIHDGGYRRPELWLSDGWDTVCLQGWEAPLYWERDGDNWQRFTTSGTHPIAPADPVCHVSYYEADAFARWAGARLPLESEWESVAESLPIDGHFADALDFEPRPSPSSTGMTQMFGSVWEWTASPYVAYPGYRPAAGVVGEYNGKFMCNQFVLRGGSCATPRSHIRASYRNFFPPHARWQFTGIRVATDAS